MSRATMALISGTEGAFPAPSCSLGTSTGTFNTSPKLPAADRRRFPRNNHLESSQRKVPNREVDVRRSKVIAGRLVGDHRKAAGAHNQNR